MGLAYEDGTFTRKRSIHNGKALYSCDACQKLDTWSKEWGWYGSYRALEDYPNDIICSCSKECMIRLIADNVIPGEAWDENEKITRKKRSKFKTVTNGE